MTLRVVNQNANILEWTNDFGITKDTLLAWVTDKVGTGVAQDISTMVTDQHLEDIFPEKMQAINNKIFEVEAIMSEDQLRKRFPKMVQALKWLGVTDYSLQKKTFKDHHNRDVKITKIIDPGGQAHRDLVSIQKPVWRILLTYDPWMKLTMSTLRRWKSCYRLDYNTIKDRASDILNPNPYMVAYVYEPGTTDIDTLDAPVGRAVIVPAGIRDELVSKKTNNLTHDSHSRRKYVCEQIVNALGAVPNSLNIKDETLKLKYCPVCGATIITKHVFCYNAIDYLIPSRLYTSHQGLPDMFNSLIVAVDKHTHKYFNLHIGLPSYSTHVIPRNAVMYTEGHIRDFKKIS